MMVIAMAPEQAPPMSYDDKQRQSCGDHRPFRTYEAALLHYVAQVREGQGDPGQEVYRCVCGAWHHGGSQVRSLGRLLAENGWTDDDA